MENTPEMIQHIVGDKHTLMLLLTVGFGILAGKLLRVVSKLMAYTIGFIAIILIGLQHLGVIYVVVNYEFITEIVQMVFWQAKEIGIAEHLFFWAPMVYGFRKKGALSVS